MRIKTALGVLTAALLCEPVTAQNVSHDDVALTAHATASSEAEGTKPESVVDGNITDTEWRAKEGTAPRDTWVELNWPGAVEFQEVVIRQSGSPKLSHFNLETRDPSGEWRPLQAIGDSE